MRSARLLPGALSAALLAACAGGTFHLDSSLSKTPALRVAGPLGFTGRYCASAKSGDQTSSGSGEAKKPEKQLGLGWDKPAKVVVGDLTGLASAPHRHLDSQPLFDKAVRRDYDRFLHSAYARVAVQASTLASSPGQPDQSQPAPLEGLLRGIQRFLRLPSTVTETMSFTFFGRRQGRMVLAACNAADAARIAGYFDAPRVAIVCRIVPAVDGVSRKLYVRGSGTWANYRFSGWLTSPEGERAVFASQNVSVMGMGGIRGFDLKSPGASQLAAISFWQVRGQNGESEPRAWMTGVHSPGWSDAVLTTLALAYVFPWPSGCDTQHIREQGQDRALDGP